MDSIIQKEAKRGIAVLILIKIMDSTIDSSGRPVPYLTDDDMATMNVSIYDYPREIWYMVPLWEVLLKTVTLVPVVTFGIFGNIALLCIVCTIRALRTSTNVLIANLAIADLATLVICPGMFMMQNFYQNYVLGAVGCKLQGFLEGSLLITSVLCLCAISYDRLTAVVFSKKSRLTTRGASIMMVTTWLVGLLLALPLAIFRNYRERNWKDYLETFCSEKTWILPRYWHVLVGALVWFPLAVMICSYSLIFSKLYRYERKVFRREHPIAVCYKKRVAKSLFVVLVVFILLRIPFTTLVFIRYDRFVNENTDQIGRGFQILWYVSHYLMFLNAAINPIIYGLTNDNFRKAYNKTRIWRCFWHSNKAKKVKRREPAVAIIGQLQPRGPCGDEKLISGWVVPSKNAPTIASGETKSSALKLPSDDTVRYSLYANAKLICSDRSMNQEDYKIHSTEYI
ncbi:neuropeptide FF receptor 2-like isoform X2 [Toxorhynchites rutilus septentrionalis]|uniref:neuropeptide FF receptor 2-like isoform X2 n=1 Tax=Toxorhynchites rutilus septentrionalis TaxID=329112 RepID=UPI002478E668|nr:neuropeptide FF receptor 2-like isoform X2 [Toxorhynchites rutilus septentrionalis]